MMEWIRNRRMTNLFGFAARSLLSRPWYSIAHTVLLSVSMSSFYLMLTLAFLIPPEWSGNFGFFQRGGLEASTDLLIFASAALLFSLCIVVILTLRMQVRVSWRSNRDNYRLLLQIGFSSRELRHLLRLEGLVLLGLALPFAIIMTLIVYRILLLNWNLDEYRERLLHLNYEAISISLITAVLLTEWTRANLVRNLGFKTEYQIREQKKAGWLRRTCKQEHARQRSSQLVWSNIKNMTRFHTPRQLIADLLTLAVSFSLIFFIYATKAGIRTPELRQGRDLVSSSLSYDIIGKGMDQRSSARSFEQLLNALPDSSDRHYDYIYLKTDASIDLDLSISELDDEYIKYLDSDKDGIIDQGDRNLQTPLASDIDAVTKANEKANELLTLTFQIYPSASIPDRDELGRVPAYLFSDLNYLKEDAIVSNRIQVVPDKSEAFNWHSSDLETHFIIHARDSSIYSPSYGSSDSQQSEDEETLELPWYINPISESLEPILLVSEKTYAELTQAKELGWMARIRVHEAASITFQTVVQRDWRGKHSQIQIVDYLSRRLEQTRINYTLDILFNMTLFFILQLIVIQLIAFTQGQFFIREKELFLLHQIGSSWRQERSIIRHYCLRVYLAAMLMAYALTYTSAFIWNRFIQPITAVSISWPILPLIIISFSLLLSIFMLTHLRFPKIRQQ